MTFQFCTDWFSSHIPLWKKYLNTFAHQPDVHMLEVGTFEGRAACWLLQHILTHPTSTLTCVDLFEMTIHKQAGMAGLLHALPPLFDLEQRFMHNITQTGSANRVNTVRGKSSETLRTLPLASYDMIYIDGSHKAHDVLCDAILSWELLKTEGILIFDDYELALSPDPLLNPRKGIDSFLDVFSGQFTILEKGWQIFLRKQSTKHTRSNGEV
ncbi:hypothetical protein COW95_03725 [Candidatus Peregrinibacteria bacterium CG22_combo_CG10-13_8_21_14_all_49_11]|nr:MAG: hypothetical protein COW95_03725 [Candidatus Peregrinibacteria bacterium CG22_combo_CG10-13_8_21_14_all_49_11]